MPSFVQDPAALPKRRLRSGLGPRSVPPPAADSRREADVELHREQVAARPGADFSSDEEEGRGHAGGEETCAQNEGQNRELDVMDVSRLTDVELKARLLQYGVNVGPIVASTRALYERKLRILLKPVSQPPPLNGAGYAAQYSDGEEDDADDEEHDSVHIGGHLETDEEQDQEGHSQMSPQHASVDQLRFSSCAFQSFSITQLVEELESRSPDISRAAMGGKVGVNNELPPAASSQMDLMTKDKNATSKSQFVSPKPSVFKQQFKEPVSDILMEMFPGTERTPTGISATRRRPIKGAAGRPVQFKYPDTPSSPGTKERRELQRHLVPIWIQILVFLFVALLFYLIFSAMEGTPDSPFAALRDSSGHEGERQGDLPSFATSEDPSLVSGEE